MAQDTAAAIYSVSGSWEGKASYSAGFTAADSTDFALHVVAVIIVNATELAPCVLPDTPTS